MNTPSFPLRQALIGISVVFSTLSHGALIPHFETGATGTPGNLVFTTGGSWTGDGTVQPFLADLGNAANSGPGADIITGFSSGTLQLTDVMLAGNSNSYTPPGFSVTHTFGVTDGTGDLRGVFTGGAGSNNHNYRIRPTAGSTMIMWTTDFSHPLHSRRRTGSNLLPWLGSLQQPANASTTVSIGGISTLTSTDGTIANGSFAPGIAGGFGASTFTGRSLGGTLTEPSSGNLQWTAVGNTGETHINSIIPADPGNLHAASSTGAYNAASLNNLLINDGERVHATSISWVIKPTGASFNGTEDFIFSFDGGRGAASALFDEAEVIPEPSRVILLILVASL